MENRPLVQIILEYDFILRKLSGTNDKAARDVPETSVVSLSKVNDAIEEIQKFLKKLNNHDNIFKPNEKDAISCFLRQYHDQILAQIKKLPKILINNTIKNAFLKSSYYDCSIGDIDLCPDYRLKNLCE